MEHKISTNQLCAYHNNNSEIMNTIKLFTITRQEIEAKDFQRFEAAFGSWPELRGAELRQHFDSLTLLVGGYNLSIDELYTIPEVRRYFTELHKRWPWWLFFLKNHEANIAVCYLCILQRVDSYKKSEAWDCAAVFDPHELLEIIKHDFCRMNLLFERAGMSDKENDRRSDEILRLFAGTTGGDSNE